MKKSLAAASAVILLSVAIGFWSGALAVPNVACYMDQGGAGFHADSGCTITIESSGILNVASGGAFKIAGTDRTTALTTAPAAVAAGYKIARGATVLDGSNPTPVTTSLTTIVSCTASINGTAAPGVGTSTISTEFATAGTLNLYAWKVTTSADNTRIASTGTETIAWICVGT